MVLPFGVTNGRPYFQEVMLDLYGGSSRSLPSLLNEGMVDLKAQLDIWIDDLTLGTGSCDDRDYPLRSDEPSLESRGFHEHLDGLRRVLVRAQKANLRFQFAKCLFAQHAVQTLGLIAGRNIVTACPKKMQAINGWPRPSRIEDLERFLATTF